MSGAPTPEQVKIATYVRLESLLRSTCRRERKELLAEITDSRRLERYGFRAFSQGDEDGIIQEIFRRTGTTSRKFFEFGAGDGLESNCAYLLLQGWSGKWVEGNPRYTALIKDSFKREIKSGQLEFSTAMVTIENINEAAPKDLDLLSIDVDGNDYYLWEALKSEPRVVVVEYNATFPPPANIVQLHQPELAWGGTTYYGASLVALAELASRKGYKLVGTSLAGVNAFFVRSDLVGDLFCPGPIALFYNPARHELGEFGFGGHRSGWGPNR